MATSHLGPCEFDRLLAKNIPHVLENIFFSLDLDSFNKCGKVCSTWNELFSTESFRKKAKNLAYQMRQNKRKLLEFSSRGDAEQVKRLLLSGISPNRVMIKTLLCDAAKGGNRDVVEMLLDKGADPDETDKGGWTPLQCAAVHSKKDAVQILLNRGADPNKVNERNVPHRSMLKWAVMTNDINMVQQLLNAGADPNTAHNDGKTALSEAIHMGYDDVVNLLLDRGADLQLALDRGTKENEHFLTYVAKSEGASFVNIAQALLDEGVDPNMTDKRRNHAVSLAVYNGNKEMVKLLLNGGADPNKASIVPNRIDSANRSCFQYSLLYWATIHHEDIVELLLDAEADPNKADCWGRTPLVVATGKAGMHDVINLLLNKGADPNKSALFGITPLYQVAKNGNTDLVGLLLDKGADPNKAIRNGNTPLHCAASFGNKDMVKILLDRGAEPDKANKYGKTPLHVAERKRHEEVAKMLLSGMSSSLE